MNIIAPYTDQFNFDKDEDQAIVAGSTIVFFMKGVTPEQRAYIVNSSLYAQLKAIQSVSDTKRTEEWYDTYFHVLKGIGWTLGQTAFATYDEKREIFTAHEAITKVAAILFDPAKSYLTIIKHVLDDLWSMNNRPLIEHFNRISQEANTARFQVILTELSPDGEVLLSLMAFELETKRNITNVLFMKMPSSQAKLKHCGTKCMINSDVSSLARDLIKEKLSQHHVDYCKILDLDFEISNRSELMESVPPLRRGVESPPFGTPEEARSRPSSAVQPEPPAVESETVMVGAAAPRAVMPGDQFTSRFFVYLQSQETEVKSVVADIAAGDTVHLGVKRYHWKRGTNVSVTLSGRHLRVTPSLQEFVWEGEQILLDFDVEVDTAEPTGRTVLKFDASVNGIPVAMLRINLEISRAGRDNRLATSHSEAARTAFASYSSKDRERVLDRVAAVRIAAGLDIFLDCLSLHPGDAWKTRLADEIRMRDLFLLFWSAESKASPWVEWEWRTALEHKGREAIQIHPLTSGLTPPDDLNDVHFGDVFMLVRDAGEAKKDKPVN